jgi:phosphatidylserine/phosphatidylglycerophosphate/cardiolipin synthase-like enzyme
MRSAVLVLMFVVSGLAGCASLPSQVGRARSVALVPGSDTRLGALVAANAAPGGLSGIRLLASGEEALQGLIALADRAERTLDIQYYLIAPDASGRLLLSHVRAAAARGVRVRILVDDLNTVGEDGRLLSLGASPHIEVRLFNPFAGGRLALWSRFLFALHDIPRINHRMHNKLFVADNALAITGGRNIGDPYFVRGGQSNFIDLDVIAAGPVVPQLSASFDAFWNSRYAYPITALTRERAGTPAATAPEAALAGAEADWLARDLDAGVLAVQWMPATVLADRPAKIASDGVAEGADGGADGGAETIADNIASLMRSATQEVLVISAYFVPGKDGVALIRDLRSQGVRVRIMTNSLASTDSPLVHDGYSRYRRELLRLGVELHEVRPRLGARRPRFHPFRRALASLHAKALVIDERTVFIGSLNMDGRSRRTNSELGLVMRSTEVARQVEALFDDISADGSYRLSLVPPGDALEWRCEEDGVERSWRRDPEASAMQRLVLAILAPFAPEELL